jgi:hypothetical protein
MPSEQMSDFGDQLAVPTLAYYDRDRASGCKEGYPRKKSLMP